ncbi:MAG: hypothetical protein CME02_06095 [Geminicoccus sp.]|nr:hypothetical protein [Geminicoccus sp.]
MASPRPDLEDLHPVGLRFAAALDGREQEREPTNSASAPAFWTPPDALRDLGVDWALTLQQAVADWHPDSVLVVDASEAPGFALQALEQGLKAVFTPEDDPAYADLSKAAERLDASVLTRRPAMQAHWTPALPRSRRRGLASAAPHPN